MKICKGCKYFNVCGDVDRTEPCKGRAIEVIMNENGKIMFFCSELQGEEQIECILNSHPEWKRDVI